MFIRINLIPIIIISLLSALPAQSQWIARGEYSELKAGESAIVYLKATADGKAFFTQSADTLRKWDIESGELLDEKYLEGIQYGACAVSDNEKYYAYSLAAYDKRKEIQITILSFEDDKVICNVLPTQMNQNSEYLAFGEEDVYLFFHPNNKNLIIGGNYMWYGPYGGGRIGFLINDDFLNNQKDNDTLTKGGVSFINISNNERFMLFNNVHSYTNTKTETGSYYRDFLLYDFNADTRYYLGKLNDDTTTYYLKTSCFDFNNTSDIITACVDDNELISWNTEDRQPINDYFLEGLTISTLKYEKNKDYLLIGANYPKDHTALLIADCLNHLIIDTILFEGFFTINEIVQTDDSTVYISCSDGYLRKIPIDNYINNITEINSNNTFSLHPNPANNKLTIQCPLPGAAKATLSLYNSLGRPVRDYTITNGSNTIDISSLVPGIYLVKLLVNDEVYSAKFIKAE